MSTRTTVAVRPITGADLPRVAEFLHARLNARLSVAEWERALVPPWSCPAPNHGFFLETGDAVAGVYAAFYSERQVDGRPERFCNLAAWCVAEEHRAEGLRLLRAVLGQRGYHFTDLSPSGAVVPLNERLGFARLDTTTVLVPNLPWPGGARAAVLTESQDISAVLTGEQLELYRDHAGARAAMHLVLRRGGRTCYVMLRRDRRKRLPLFATVLHVSDPELFADCAGTVARHLLLHHRLPFTLAELRVVRRPPRPGVRLRGRPKMFRSRTLRADQVDYLYSELTCVPW